MLTIHLFTRAGDLVHEAQIPEPPGDEAPDVIVWGARLFVVPDVDGPMAALRVLDEDLAYIEALAYTIPTLHVAPTWGAALGRRS